MRVLRVLFILMCSVFVTSNGYKILGIFNLNGKSHYIVGSALMKGLAERGHEVTVISPFPQKTPLKNYRDVSNLRIFKDTEDFLKNFLGKQHNAFQTIPSLYEMGIIATNSTLREKCVQDLLKSNEKFDLVIMEVFVNEALLGFGEHFNVPVIGISPFGSSLFTDELVGSPAPLSYVPNIFVPLTDHMNLWERMQNIVIHTYQLLFNHLSYLPVQEELYKKYFPNARASLYDLRRNVSLVLLNTHYTIGFPRPYVPNMIEVGGMQINTKPKPLPKDIQQFLESAKDGAIYFSLGSNFKGTMLPEDKRNAILKVFASLKQKVLWKFEDKNLPGKSDNILISDWFPQDDILAHPNVKVFITHGGLLSTTESIYHGVPVIGIPMFGDQFLNMARAEKSGYGITLHLKDLDEHNLKHAITEIINNKKYAEKMKIMSDSFRDQPMTPLETAIYWVEYVVRHKGAPHMHSAGVDLNFIQYHNLDAFAIIFSVIFLVFYVVYIAIRKVIKLILGKKKVQSRSVHKKKVKSQ